MLETIQEMITKLTDAEYLDLKNWIYTEENLVRQNRASVELLRTREVVERRKSGIIPTPEAIGFRQLGELDNINDVPKWVDPQGDPDKAYLRDEVVAHNGRAWESQLPTINLETPGVASEYVWRDLTELMRSPAYVPPAPVEQPEGDSPA